ncbi:MAG: hypothetical protein ABSC57_10715 [Syntrophales bacterium]
MSPKSPYSMYGGASRAEQGASMRAHAVHRRVATRFLACGRPAPQIAFLFGPLLTPQKRAGAGFPHRGPETYGDRSFIVAFLTVRP